jgi:phosphatidate cytidylyltransferase
MLKTRLLTALWCIPLVIAAVWFDWPLNWFTVFAAVVGVLASVEFYHLVGVAKVIPLAVVGVALTLLFIIIPQFKININVPLVSLLVTAAIALPMILMLFLPRQEGLFRLWAWTLTGVLYIGWFIGYLVSLRLMPDIIGFPDTGRNLVFFTLFVTFGSDSAAYFIGKAIGSHKMAPAISPGKTWEGAAAGVIGAVIVSLFFMLNTIFQIPLGLIQTVILGVLVSVFGQFGDLAESMLKRGTGVKDSGTLMPGHGGMLDRLDSILFAGVVVYLFYMLVYLKI